MLVVFGSAKSRNEVLTENPRVTGSIPVLGTDLRTTAFCCSSYFFCFVGLPLKKGEVL